VRHPRKSVLLLASGLPVQYRALRCAEAAGFDVYVLGTKQAVLLRHSRFCRGFFEMPQWPPDDFIGQAEVMLRYMEDLRARYSLDVLLPADERSIRLLYQVLDRVRIPTLPMPRVEIFDLLDDKWTFGQLCCHLDIPVPRTWLFNTKSELLTALEQSTLPDRIVIKHLRLFGEFGIHYLNRQNAKEQIEQTEYAPLLVQEHVDGVDLGLTIHAVKGQAVAAIWHQKRGQNVVLSHHDAYLDYVCRIARHIKADGILNFDARIRPNGELLVFECNPRVYLSMDYALLTGINWVEIALRDWTNHDGSILIREGEMKTLWGTLRSLHTPWRITSSDLRMAIYALRDPIPQAIELARLAVKKCPVKLRAALLEMPLLRPLWE